MQLTKNEALVAMQLIDAGIKSIGAEVFANGRGPVVQAILAKLEQVMQAPVEPPASEPDGKA